MLRTQHLPLLRSLLQFTLLSIHLCRAYPDPNNDEKPEIGTINCDSNKDCANGNEGIHAFSYCHFRTDLWNIGFCTCLDGRTSVNGGECKCPTESPKTGSCLVIDPEIETACNKLDCGDQGTCELVAGGAYCDCQNGWEGQNCEEEGPPWWISIPMAILVTSIGAVVMLSLGYLQWKRNDRKRRNNEPHWSPQTGDPQSTPGQTVE